MSKLRYLPWLSLLSLAACVGAPGSDRPSEPTPPPAPHVVRIVLKVLPSGSAVPSRIVREATRISGVGVRYVSAVSAQWHSLALICPDIVSCNTAVERLEADTSVFESVQRDARKQPS